MVGNNFIYGNYFKSEKWLSVAGSVKKLLDLVHVMRMYWEIIITNKKNETMPTDRHDL